jgi:septin family protein
MQYVRNDLQHKRETITSHANIDTKPIQLRYPTNTTSVNNNCDNKKQLQTRTMISCTATRTQMQTYEDNDGNISRKRLQHDRVHSCKHLLTPIATSLNNDCNITELCPGLPRDRPLAVVTSSPQQSSRGGGGL